MTKFKRQEQVRIMEDGRNSRTIYTIIEIKKSRDGKLLYLLRKDDDESILKLYYKNDYSSLIPVC
ncbi:MAG TPA: hypothetical protein VJ571_02370 [Candidatus Nitrosotalea sp.]|nr:hypothetical protein [Candidatus Nitrosotalea sp.]